MGGPPDGGAGGQSITPDRELELLAELHLKRGNLAEAASAYDRAVGKAREVHIDPALDVQQAKAVMDRANARLQELSRKLAETYLKLNDLEAAKKALAYAPIQLAPKQGTPAAAKPAPSIKLPEKLILTVSKQALDQIGSGAISFAEFQKQVTIEIPNVNPPGEAAK
jgi:tetratricopeptide (TPR) repeat protein